eukprot:5631506-Alexandrium_andersonii.AAC.1
MATSPEFSKQLRRGRRPCYVLASAPSEAYQVGLTIQPEVRATRKPVREWAATPVLAPRGSRPL